MASAAAKRAEEIAQEYNPQGLVPFPFKDIEEKCEDLQIFLSSDIPEDISGMIAYDSKEKFFSIFINQVKPEVRQYFTIAHEFGHYFLHHTLIKESGMLIDQEESNGQIILYREDTTHTQESDFVRLESEANTFAASLLMPEEYVINAWNTLHSIQECAKVFQVSVVAMSIRLERLGLII